MNYPTKRITLDINSSVSQTTLYLPRTDSGRKYIFNLIDDGRPFIIGEGCTAVFKAVKPDGNLVFNVCEIIDNAIIYEVTEQTTAISGIFECEITLYGSDNGQITSPRFCFATSETLFSDSEVVSTGEFSALRAALQQADNISASVTKDNGIVFLTVTDKDGITHTVSVGEDGTGIQTVEIINGELVVTLTDSQVFNLGTVKGKDGKDGQDGRDFAWELINTVEVPSDESVSIITINADSEGDSFRLKKMKLVIAVDNTSGTFNPTGNLGINLKSADTNAYSGFAYVSKSVFPSAGKFSRIILDAEVVGGNAYGTITIKAGLNDLSNAQKFNLVAPQNTLDFTLENDYIEEVQLQPYGYELSSITVEIWGIRV